MRIQSNYKTFNVDSQYKIHEIVHKKVNFEWTNINKFQIAYANKMHFNESLCNRPKHMFDYM